MPFKALLPTVSFAENIQMAFTGYKRKTSRIQFYHVLPEASHSFVYLDNNVFKPLL